MRWAGALLILLVVDAAAAQLYRPNREYRSLNADTYQITVQKNGQLDVTLGSGGAVFVDAFPMAWVEGEREPEPMTVDGTWSRRFGTRDPLGAGNGMMLRKKECTWSLRTYPTKPFLAVQVAYENQRKKPVTIRALYPWCVGEPRKGALHLGTNTADSVRRDGAIALPVRDERGEYLGARNLALYNRTSGRSVIAGFLTQRTAQADFAVDARKPEKRPGFDRVRIGCYFDPPVTLEPGERLESDVLYLGLAELDPVVGLERYVRAVQALNEVRLPDGAPAHVWLNGAGLAGGFQALLNEHPPFVARPPRPLDLFEATPFTMWWWDGAGAAALALTNASDESVAHTVPLNALGLRGGYYHLYAAGAHEYLGLAGASVAVELAPEQQRVLRIVPRLSRPHAIVRASAPFAPIDQTWDGQLLQGRFTAAREQERVLIASPPPYRPAPSPSVTPLKDDVYALAVEANPGGKATWSVRFETESEPR